MESGTLSKLYPAWVEKLYSDFKTCDITVKKDILVKLYKVASESIDHLKEGDPRFLCVKHIADCSDHPFTLLLKRNLNAVDVTITENALQDIPRDKRGIRACGLYKIVETGFTFSFPVLSKDSSVSTSSSTSEIGLPITDTIQKVKILKPKLENEPQSAIEKFISEMELLGNFRNRKGIAQINHLGKYVGHHHKQKVEKVVAIVPHCPMDLFDFGQDEKVSALRANNYPEFLKMIKSICQSLAEGVACIHEQKLMHLDLKGENVLINFDPSSHIILCSITDFGTCKRADAADTGFCGGTLATFSPRRWNTFLNGGTVSDLRPSDDIWAMGCILHELIYGEVPRKNRLLSKLDELVSNQDKERNYEAKFQLLSAKISTAMRQFAEQDMLEVFEAMPEKTEETEGEHPKNSHLSKRDFSFQYLFKQIFNAFNSTITAAEIVEMLPLVFDHEIQRAIQTQSIKKVKD